MQLKRYGAISIITNMSTDTLNVSLELNTDGKVHLVQVAIPARGAIDYAAQALDEMARQLRLLARPIPKAERDAIAGGQAELPQTQFTNARGFVTEGTCQPGCNGDHTAGPCGVVSPNTGPTGFTPPTC